MELSWGQPFGLEEALQSLGQGLVHLAVNPDQGMLMFVNPLHWEVRVRVRENRRVQTSVLL